MFDFSQLPFMAQLAGMAASNPEQFATLAASKGVQPPAANGPAGSVGAALNGAGLQQALPPGTDPTGMPIPPTTPVPNPPTTPTPATAANDPMKAITDALSAVKSVAPPQVEQAPLAPATPVPQGRGQPNTDAARLIAGLLQPQAPASIPTLGAIIGGNYRRFA